MKTKRTLLALVTLFLVVLAGLGHANSPGGQLVPGFESKAALHVPKETHPGMENSATKSAMLDAAPSRVGTWASWVADHGKGLGLGLLVGGAVAVGLVLVVGLVVAGPVLGVIALGAIAAGAIYGLITGAARFNVVDAVVQSLIGGVSAGVGFGLGAGAFLAGRALTVARAGLTVLTGGFASLGSYLVQTPHPTGHGAGAAFGWGAATAGVFLGLGALAGKFQGAIRPALGRLPGLLRFGSGPPGMSSAVYREVAVTVESDLAAAEPGATKSVASVLERAETAPAGATPQAGGKANQAAPLMGTHREIRAADVKDSHHIIQEATVRDIPGYNRNDAPVVHLPGPSTDRGSPHYLATLVQRANGGGTYGEERAVAAEGLRAAGLSDTDIQRALAMADQYFYGLGITDQTPLRIPGNRAK